MHLILLCCNTAITFATIHFVHLQELKVISSYFTSCSSIWNEKYAKYIPAVSPLEIMELQRIWTLLIVCNP